MMQPLQASMRLLHQAVATLQVAQALQDLTVLQAAAANLQAAPRQAVAHLAAQVRQVALVRQASMRLLHQAVVTLQVALRQVVKTRQAVATVS